MASTIFDITRIVLAIPPSYALYAKVLSWVTLAVLSFLGLSEAFGSHLGYSKFANLGSKDRPKISSRLGMLLLYSPSLLVAGLASTLLLLSRSGSGDDGGDARFLLLSLALTIHYFKRVFEVIFVHKYSGVMATDSTILISLSYTSSTANLIYLHHKLFLYPTNTHQFIDTKYVGIVLFLVGICGNLYHHIVLSQLRPKGNGSYKIPKGGLYGLVICAHYLFEIIGFVGVSFISQTLFGYCFTVGSMFYLMGRSYATRKWYVSKFENFPKQVKALIPFVF